MTESRHAKLAGRQGARGRRAAARATMALLASGRLLERPASLLERHQMAAFRPEPVDMGVQDMLLWPPERLANGVSQNQMGNLGLLKPPSSPSSGSFPARKGPHHDIM